MLPRYTLHDKPDSAIGNLATVALGYLRKTLPGSKSAPDVNNIYCGQFGSAVSFTARPLFGICMDPTFQSRRSATLRISISHILGRSAPGEMIRIAAKWIVARVHSQKIGVRPGLQNKNDAMHEVVPFVEADSTVALQRGSLPRPAFIWSAFINAGPQAFDLLFRELRNWFRMGDGHRISSIDLLVLAGVVVSNTASAYPSILTPKQHLSVPECAT